MKQEWVGLCTRLILSNRHSFYTASSKVFRTRTARFEAWDGDLVMDDVGYTKSKMTMLVKLYTHEESLSSAVKQWEARCQKKRYGSVGFSCYNHLLKAHSTENANRIASQMGPCLQAVTVTMTKDKTAEVDIFYRTSELLKKFPADLVYARDHLTSRFDFSEVPLAGVTMHFANLSVSPIYLATLLPHIDDPVSYMMRIADRDPVFHQMAVGWLHTLLDPEQVAKGFSYKPLEHGSSNLHRKLVDSDRLELLEYVTEANQDKINRRKNR